MEQMKNPNEFLEDGKLYVKEIKMCECKQKDGEYYNLYCKIIQRGCRNYAYRKGSGRIFKDNGKGLGLLPNAQKTVDEAIDAFDKFADVEGNAEFTEIACKDAELSIFYRKNQEGYDFVLKFQNMETHSLTVKIFRDEGIYSFLHELRFWNREIKESQSKKLFSNPTENNIYEHPFIIEARKHHDLKAEINIKCFYGLATQDDCEQLAKLLGYKILPPLPEKFDKMYTVDVNTMTEESFDLLRHSWYSCSHRPAFAMRGSTHNKFSLNPHKKYMVDAAKIDSPAISFDEFLKLFENVDKNDGTN